MSDRLVKIDLPGPVLTALELLRADNREAHIVGGCVRDHLLARDPDDYDITTDATPKEIIKIFSGERVLETGLKHGTVTVIIDGMPMEVTTYRSEGPYSDNRRPDNVTFVNNLTEDLSRRDFTINAIAYSQEEGLSDPFGGTADLKAKLIRCVGDPEKRFSEDALRIMRAVRFSSTLGFDIEPKTRDAVFKFSHLLLNIAAERISAELTGILCGRRAGKTVMEYAEVLGVWIPEILPMIGYDQKNPYHIHELLEHTAIAVDNVPATLHLRLAALLHDIGKPSCYSEDESGFAHFYGHQEKSASAADNIMKRLRFDRLTSDKVIRLVKYHDSPIKPEDKSVRRWINKLKPDMFFDLLSMKRADINAQNPEKKGRLEIVEELENIARRIIDRGDCLFLKDLKIDGEDLQSLGFKPGKQIGEILNTLLSNVLDGELENSKSELMKAAEKMK